MNPDVSGLPNWNGPGGPQEERGQRNTMRMNMAMLMAGTRMPPPTQVDSGGYHALFPQGAFGLQPGNQMWNQSAEHAPRPLQPFPVVSGHPTPQLSAAEMIDPQRIAKWDLAIVDWM